MEKDIFSLIVSEETAYQTLPVNVIENYDWNMSEHIKISTLYKNSVYLTGKDDNKPFKNIIRPILNLQYRAEGFDVKDIVLFVNDVKNYFKSFLIKKFHEKWARENKIDTFIDEMVESYVDFGGALIKDVNEVRPEVVPLQRIAFCDQTDILSGVICEKHFYAPDQLKEMESKGWKNIDEVITLAENYKKDNLTEGKKTKTPGKYIEVYEIHGVFPLGWLASEDNDIEADDTKFSRQIHIITFYQPKEGEKKGIVLFKGKEKELPYKLVLRDKIYGRALGFGGAEELFEPQVWVNYDVIRMKGMLDAAAKIIYQTADVAFANRNKITDLENQEILVHEDGKPLSQINTNPVNIRVFENSVAEWEEHAKSMGAAYDPTMGKEPVSGTPFSSLALQVQQGLGMHEYRKGKLATFLDEVYKDWIIPHISKEISKGQEFLSELDLDELQSVADSLVINETNKVIKERILNGELIQDEEIETFKQKTRDEFMKGGNKKFIQILKDELKDAPIDVSVNISGKQKNLAGIVDKLTNVWRSIISNPAILQQAPMAKLFNQILESSGLSPIDFSGFTAPQPQQIQQPSVQVAPAEALAIK